MKNAIILLILLTTISACSPKVEYITQYIQVKPTYCPSPTIPTLPKLHYELLTTPRNAEILLKRELIVDDYINSLHNTIRCYDKQVGD